MIERLEGLSRRGLRRDPVVLASPCGPRIQVNGREVVSFCSNDYLCLANDPLVKAAAAEAIERWGVGSGASRLISGTMCPHVQLEQELARFKGTESAVVTSSGWMANRLAIHALAGRGDLVLLDKLDHASIIDAALSCGARVRTYPHCDTKRLRALLRRDRASYRRCIIVTDSLFSMDGDLAPLDELVAIKDQYDAVLLVDEAHATGVLGPNGRGAAELFRLEDRIDATVGTLSKAIGTLGGFVAGPRALIDTIRNTGRAYIYTTALPAAVCAAALASLRIIREQPERRERLLSMAEALRNKLVDAGLDVRRSASQIIPVVIGPAEAAVAASRELLDAGLLTPAIRPPTVPRGTSRLRISLCAGHAPGDVNRLAELLPRIVSGVEGA